MGRKQDGSQSESIRIAEHEMVRRQADAAAVELGRDSYDAQMLKSFEQTARQEIRDQFGI